MKLLKYIIILCFIVLFTDFSKASTILHGASSNFTVTGVVQCPDSDEDGFFDDACGGFDCDDSDELVNPFKVLAVLQSNIPELLLQSHYAEQNPSVSGKREVILSLYLSGD